MRHRSTVDRLQDKIPTGQVEDLPLTGNADTVAVIDLGVYKNCSYIQHGLFSTIYRASAPPEASPCVSGAIKPGSLVALKLTIPSTQTAPHDSIRESRVLREARGASVIPLLESFYQAGDRLILVFPYMRCDLETLLVQQKLGGKLALSCLRDVFQALAHLHSLGIIHRDVKPSNILIESPVGPAYLADFGIAWSPTDPAAEPPSEKITDVGTTHYRAPELLFGNTAYDTSLDLWAAGCVCAEVFHRTAPPNNRNSKHWTLFDSGDLGSELALISSIFRSLGTPSVETWPEAVRFRDWGKMEFFQYPRQEWADLLPRASEAERDLVSRLVVFESGQRLKADEALKHEVFSSETAKPTDLV